MPCGDGLESEIVDRESVAWDQGFHSPDEALVVGRYALIAVLVAVQDAPRRREGSPPAPRPVGHRLDEDLGVGVVVRVAVSYDDGVEALGAEAGPVGEDDGARPRVDVDIRPAVDQPDARSAAPLGDHGEAAPACAEEVDAEGDQGSVYRGRWV